MMMLKWPPWRRKVRVTPELAEARRAREAAEALLHDSRHNVVLPLREMRLENNVSARLNFIISQAARRRHDPGEEHG